jgi:EAL domain-containing protein (putative c-di-GMP-specific phosphodiesterase class I)/HPt (histidine-containing phosphotransfer) domain-containing protein
MTRAVVLDSSRLANLIGKVDAQQLSKLVGLFTTTARNDFVACRQHLTEGDGVMLAFAMHKLKSSARTVGAMHFAEIAESVEVAGREARLDDVARLFAELEVALAQVETAARAEIQPLSSVTTPDGRTGCSGRMEASVRSSGRPAGMAGGQMLTKDDILDGIRGNEFEMHFQSKADTLTLQVMGVEALARWRHKGRYISPAVFIAAAEQHDLIEMLSETLLSKALVSSARLAEEGFPLPVSINFFTMWLAVRHLPELIAACVVGTGLKPDDVTLEIPEAGLADDMETALNTLARLRGKGFKLSIDDFGAGSLSLEQLGRLDVEEIKIDGGVVHRATREAAARSVLVSTIEIARELEVTSVAQGVETREHLDLVRDVGCDQVQGWFIAPPMPVADLAVWLQERRQ